ncbi:hypothetical protein B0H16DRAFT_1520708 [Mycena metata]|uniref:Uncharacterized protein n=1 Tax=Mycena metata TaxID=1033252 RepID=A0AAD7JN73_9AGAR|nr:hypothetical protein B0H16DRAFT_1520708 [Mycena metata]
MGGAGSNVAAICNCSTDSFLRMFLLILVFSLIILLVCLDWSLRFPLIFVILLVILLVCLNWCLVLFLVVFVAFIDWLCRPYFPVKDFFEPL